MDHETDVLVLGAGLAGLRAAWAALSANPTCRVLLAAPSASPAGSSFTNVNARLGLMAPRTDAERERFTARAVQLAAPGFIRPELARILADEAAARLDELAALGVPLQTDSHGERALHPGCFAHDLPCAAVLTDLPRTYELLLNALRAMGGELLAGHLAVELVTLPEHGCCGAILAPLAGGKATLVRAGAVVLALGGPAPLFEQQLAAAGAPGFSHALLQGAGAELANTGFLQLLWSERESRRFVRLAHLARPGAAVIAPDGQRVPLPEDLSALARERATHCPLAWGRADAALDHFALDHADAEGFTTLDLPDASPVQAAPMAHSGNGGAVVDEHGATSVPGLFAAGECTTVMHGANRIGGAMVAATQVFGARAGAAAAQHAAEQGIAPGKLFTDATKLCHLAATGLPPVPDRFCPILTQADLAKLLTSDQQHVDNTANTIRAAASDSVSPFDRLRSRSALTVVQNLHKFVWRVNDLPENQGCCSTTDDF